MTCSLPVLPGGPDGGVDLAQRGHAGGDHDRLAGLGHPADQRQVDDLGRRDLVGRRVQLLQEVDRGRVERAGERQQAELAGQVEDRLVPLPRRATPRCRGRSSAGRPTARGRPRCGTRAVRVDRERVGRVRLQLERSAHRTSATARTMSSARSRLPLWLPDTSAMIIGGCSGPTGTSPIWIVRSLPEHRSCVTPSGTARASVGAAQADRIDTDVARRRSRRPSARPRRSRGAGSSGGPPCCSPAPRPGPSRSSRRMRSRPPPGTRPATPAASRRAPSRPSMSR